MKLISPRHLAILTALCNLPTSPYCEQYVIEWIRSFAADRGMRATLDRAGNLYVHYHRSPSGRARKNPLILEAHMDHPGYILKKQSKGGTLHAQFRGGVKPSHFHNTSAQFWLPEPTQRRPQFPIPNSQFPPFPPTPAGRWIPAKVLSVAKEKKEDFRIIKLKLEDKSVKLPSNAIGMWNLPDAAVSRKAIFSARGCDDVGGVSAIVCLLDELHTKKIDAHVIGMFSRAEEVGFAGVLAALNDNVLPKTCPVIGLETSKALPTAPQGQGPIIRVGDKTGLFSSGLTHFIAQAAGHIADDAPAKDPFLYQRKLMDGGTCNTTPFIAFGYDAAAMCVALGNYHNMTIKGDAGWGDGAKTGPGIASETIHLGDFEGLVRILVETVTRMPTYKPGFGVMKERLAKMHHEQKPLIYKPPLAPEFTF